MDREYLIELIMKLVKEHSSKGMDYLYYPDNLITSLGMKFIEDKNYDYDYNYREFLESFCNEDNLIEIINDMEFDLVEGKIKVEEYKPLEIIVYGKTKDSAMVKLRSIILNAKYKFERVDFYCALISYECKTKNGDIYRAVSAFESIRKYKYDYAYIDKDIDIMVIDDVIIPSRYCASKYVKNYEFY